MEYIAPIISAIGVIIMGWFKYDQSRKDKMTELKIEMLKKEEQIKSQRRNDSSAIVFGELWNVLYNLKADRVYIVQPHPLGNECLLSVYYEVKRKGVEGMRPKIHNMKMSEVGKFSADLSRNIFMYITDIDDQVQDKYAKSLLSSCGCVAAIVKKLNDNRHDWIGSILCEFTRPMTTSEEQARAVLHEAAMNIQYLLPEIQEPVNIN